MIIYLWVSSYTHFILIPYQQSVVVGIKYLIRKELKIAIEVIVYIRPQCYSIALFSKICIFAVGKNSCVFEKRLFSALLIKSR